MQALEQSIATGITFGASHEMIVRVDAAFNPSQIWPAAASLTCLQEHLHHVVHRLLAEFLQPLTAPVRPLHTVVREKQQAGASVLECDRSSDSGDSSSSSSGIEDSLAVCLQFLASKSSFHLVTCQLHTIAQCMQLCRQHTPAFECACILEPIVSQPGGPLHSGVISGFCSSGHCGGLCISHQYIVMFCSLLR